MGWAPGDLDGGAPGPVVNFESYTIITITREKRINTIILLL